MLNGFMTDNYELTVRHNGTNWIAEIRVLDAGPGCFDYPSRIRGAAPTPNEAFEKAMWTACSILDGLPQHLYHPHEYNPRAREEAIEFSRKLVEVNRALVG